MKTPTPTNKIIEDVMGAFVKVRTEAVSEMLDDPYGGGLYRTSRLFEKLDAFIAKSITNAVRQVGDEIIGSMEFDNGGQTTFGHIRNQLRIEQRAKLKEILK